MRFARATDESVACRVTVDARFQGWRGVVHGGVVALLLDEAMAYAAAARGIVGMTADLRTRFRRSVPVDAPVDVRANVLWERRGVLAIAASVVDAAGTLLASGEGRFVARGTLAAGERFGSLDGRS